MVTPVAGFSNSTVRIQCKVIGTCGELGFNALFDSGFSGDISIPQNVAVNIGLEGAGVGNVMLADGSTNTVQLYSGKVQLGDSIYDATYMIMGTEVLLGMGLVLENYRVCMDFKEMDVALDEINASRKEAMAERLTPLLQRLIM